MDGERPEEADGASILAAAARATADYSDAVAGGTGAITRGVVRPS